MLVQSFEQQDEEEDTFSGMKMEDVPSIPSYFRSAMTTSAGRQHAKPLRQAFYNTVALAFLCVSAFVTLGAYCVLEAFLRPLVWAALCGNVLFPFKKGLTRTLRTWLRQLDESDTTLILGSAVLPFQLLLKAMGQLEHIGKMYWKLLLAVFIVVPACYMLVVFHPFESIFNAVGTATRTTVGLLGLFDNSIAVWSLVLFYVVTLVFWQKEVSESDVLMIVNQFFSALVWFVLVFHVISLTGSWKLPILIGLFVLIGLGYTHKDNNNEDTSDSGSDSDAPPADFHARRGRRQSVVKTVVDNTLTAVGIKERKPKSILKRPATHNEKSLRNVALPEDEVFDSASLFNERPSSNVSFKNSGRSRSKTTTELPEPTTEQSTSLSSTLLPFSSPRKPRCNQSTPYFIALFWLFALLFFWRNMWCIPALCILLLMKYGAALFFKNQLNHIIMDSLHQFYEQRKDLIFPSVCRRTLSLLRMGDKKVLLSIAGSLHELTSTIIMFSLVFFSFIVAALFAVQVQKESSYLLTLASDVMNETISSNNQVSSWLNLSNSELFSSVDDQSFHSGYVLVRGKTAEYISSMIANDNNTQIEHQVAEIMDQLYHAWAEEEPHNASQHHQEPDNTEESGIWARLHRVYTGSDILKLIEVINSNLHMLYAILDSVWQLVKGNVSLMLTIATTVTSAGSFIFNSLLSCAIFLTTLFYLLNSSTNEYLIKEWLVGISMGTRFGDSISRAVQEVFGASLKMATFYFFFTWLTHDAFCVNLVFIPAALAALLAVVPFIGTYWAALPAALELWLVQKDGVLAFSLLLLHYLPPYVVDPAIYSEIGEGGHPEITGLAVAGGVYCFGLEGAFIGPFVLCCLIVAFDIYNGIMNSNDYRRFSIF